MTKQKRGMSVKEVSAAQSRDFAAHRHARQERALEVVEELHAAGFGRLNIVSISIPTDTYLIHVIVDEAEISADRLELILEAAHRAHANVRLEDVWSNQSKVSRISLWPLDTD